MDQPIYITAVIPAHNEAGDITRTIRSIRGHVDRIVVACDNCTDRTANVARLAGADDIFSTVDNHARKAGALNQALRYHINWKIPYQYLLMIDADTYLPDPDRWFAKAKALVYPSRRQHTSARASRMGWLGQRMLNLFRPKRYQKLFEHRNYDCIGGVFEAGPDDSGSVVDEGQRIEWIDYQNKIARSRRVFVLTGTCSLVSALMMKRIYRMHAHRYFYSTASLTEDFALTVDLKEAGARMISPADCVCVTGTKHSWKALLRQRRRWYLGALQEIFHHPLDSVMWMYWRQQIGLLVSVIAFLLFIGVSVWGYLTFSPSFALLWATLFAVFDVSNLIGIWRNSDGYDKLWTASVFGMLAYSFMLQLAYLWAWLTIVTGQKVYWNRDELPTPKGVGF